MIKVTYRSKITVLLFVLILSLLVWVPTVSAAVSLLHPTGDNLFRVGQTINIRWSTEDAGMWIALSYSTDGGSSWIPIETVPDVGGSYQWTIPAMERTDTARVRVIRHFFLSPKPSEVATSGNFTVVNIVHEAPSNFQAVPISSTEIHLTWTDNSEIENYFELARSIIGSCPEHLENLSANTVEFYDRDLLPNMTYQYFINAYNLLWGPTPMVTASATTPPLSPEPERPGEPEIVEPEIPEPGDTEPTIIKLSIGSKQYHVNGSLRTMDTAPMIREGRTLLPIRFIAEPLGGALGWDTAQQKAIVAMGTKEVELWIGQNRARVNGVYQYIDSYNHNVVPIIVPPGRTMLPLRFIAETLGCRVDWNGATQEVTVTYPTP